MFSIRRKQSALSEETFLVSASGMSTGRYVINLSPLLWKLLEVDFICDFTEADYLTIGYADDMALFIREKFLKTTKDAAGSSVKIRRLG